MPGGAFVEYRYAFWRVWQGAMGRETSDLGGKVELLESAAGGVMMSLGVESY